MSEQLLKEIKEDLKCLKQDLLNINHKYYHDIVGNRYSALLCRWMGLFEEIKKVDNFAYKSSVLNLIKETEDEIGEKLEQFLNNLPNTPLEIVPVNAILRLGITPRFGFLSNLKIEVDRNFAWAKNEFKG